ncbi:MAG: hypothetical protein QXU98_05490 [Candidatus Parvarchaeota archaeon]
MDKSFGDSIGLKGKFELLHFRNGEVIERREIHNVICNVGIAKIAGLVAGTATGGFDYMATGTGTAAAAATNTALETEVLRVSTTNSLVTTSVTNDTSQFVATFNYTATYAITEAGIFDASSGGNLLSRQVFAPVNVVSGDSIQITWKVQA